MIKTAQQTIVLAVSSKFGRKVYGKICELNDVDQIITDEHLDEKTRQQLLDKGIDIIVV